MITRTIISLLASPGITVGCALRGTPTVNITRIQKRQLGAASEAEKLTGNGNPYAVGENESVGRQWRKKNEPTGVVLSKAWLARSGVQKRKKKYLTTMVGSIKLASKGRNEKRHRSLKKHHSLLT